MYTMYVCCVQFADNMFIEFCLSFLISSLTSIFFCFYFFYSYLFPYKYIWFCSVVLIDFENKHCLKMFYFVLILFLQKNNVIKHYKDLNNLLSLYLTFSPNFYLYFLGDLFKSINFYIHLTLSSLQKLPTKPKQTNNVYQSSKKNAIL